MFCNSLAVRASCPSIMISGGGNFPVRKKEKQNSRRDSLHKEWVYLDSYADKIEHLLTMEQPIFSGDERAVALPACHRISAGAS